MEYLRPDPPPSIQLSSKITTFSLIILELTKVPLNSFRAHQSRVISYQQSNHNSLSQSKYISYHSSMDTMFV